MNAKPGVLPTEITVRTGSPRDLQAVRALAHRVWHAHYPPIIGTAQVEYMLARGYAIDVLRRFVGSPDAGLELGEREGALVGFAAWLVNGEAGDEIKLDRLYVEMSQQRSGVGGRLIDAVVRRARARGARSLVLNVNKHNVSAQAAYRKRGFEVREAVVVDIGGGFVMDDYVMARPL